MMKYYWIRKGMKAHMVQGRKSICGISTKFLYEFNREPFYSICKNCFRVSKSKGV